MPFDGSFYLLHKSASPPPAIYKAGIAVKRSSGPLALRWRPRPPRRRNHRLRNRLHRLPTGVCCLGETDLDESTSFFRMVQTGDDRGGRDPGAVDCAAGHPGFDRHQHVSRPDHCSTGADAGPLGEAGQDGPARAAFAQGQCGRSADWRRSALRAGRFCEGQIGEASDQALVAAAWQSATAGNRVGGACHRFDQEPGKPMELEHAQAPASG